MFVIVQAWDNLPPDVVKNHGIPEAIGLALKHAVSLYILKPCSSVYWFHRLTENNGP